MIRIILNNKNYEVPTEWKDITLKQYCNAFHNLKESEDKEDIKQARYNEAIVISRLLGETDDFAMNLPIEIYSLFQDKVSFIFDIKEFITADPKSTILVNGDAYSLVDIKDMPFRQYIDIEETLKDEENEYKFISLLSIVLKKVGSNKKYENEDSELTKALESLTADKALPFIYSILKKNTYLQRLTALSTMEEEATSL